MNNIITYREILAEGKKLAKIVANRDTTPENIKEKKEDINKIGQVSNGTLVTAKEALDEGLELTDFFNGTIPVTRENENDYYPIIDSQNRTMAYCELLKENPDFEHDFVYEFLPSNRSYTIQQFIDRTNNSGHSWKLKDYVHGATILHSDSPTLTFINELVKKGYSPSTASKLATLNTTITSKMLRSALDTTGKIDDAFYNNNNLDYGKRLVKAAEPTLKIDLLSHRTIADWIISTLNNVDHKAEGVTSLEAFFCQITKEQAKELKAIKKDSGHSKEENQQGKLTALYKSFKTE